MNVDTKPSIIKFLECVIANDMDQADTIFQSIVEENLKNKLKKAYKNPKTDPIKKSAKSKKAAKAKK